MADEQRMPLPRNIANWIESSDYDIKTADHIIDLGPEGGDEGGKIVAQGTPEAVARVAGSYTGRYLKKVLS